MKLNKPLSALFAAVLILILATILVVSAYSDASSTETTSPGCLIYRADRCPIDRLSAPAAPETTSTTSTTIDLSFLNTTTTTIGTVVPKQPENAGTNYTPSTHRNDHSDRWDVLAQCETGGDWSANTGNGYGGGLQFAHGPKWSTWTSFGGGEFSAHPWEATREQQIAVAERVLASSGYGAWPGCSRRHGWLR
jgi:hypothetical protein